MHVLYLHGFASSAQSSKARFFAGRFGARGIPLHCPDFNDPDFSTLTTTRMVEQTEEALRRLAPEPAVLMGSSLGGYVAWHVTARAEASPPGQAPVARLVLLAPAFDFGLVPPHDMDADALAAWKATGWHPFFHHTYGEVRQVHYGLYEDARRYRSDRAVVTIPTLAFQGTRDTVVDPAMVTAFAASRPNILLRLLDDGHQLLDHLDALWHDTAAFVGLSA